jgi:hypothetical protein
VPPSVERQAEKREHVFTAKGLSVTATRDARGIAPGCGPVQITPDFVLSGEDREYGTVA